MPADRASRLLIYLPLIVLGAALLILFHRLLMGDALFWGLPTLQFYPWREYAFAQLRAGELPLWSAFNGAGAPLFANYQSALLYPLSWLGLILPLPFAMSITAVLHLFIAGWGMWKFTGALGLSPLGRGLAALAFGLTQYTVARLGTYPTIQAVAWAGWLLWSADALLRDGRRWAAPALAGFVALVLLAGHAQTAWYLLLLTALFTLWRGLTIRPLPVLHVIAVGMVTALGAGIAALQLAATAELLGQSQRGDGVDYAFAMNFSYAPVRTFNLLSANIFGTPADGSFMTGGAYFEDALYLGLIPLISAIAALIGYWRGRHTDRPAYERDTPFWLAIGIIGFTFALGSSTPIFPFLYTHIPTFDLFQAPVRWHLWTVMALSVLAGIGASAWGSGGSVRRWTKRGLAVCAALMLAGGVLLTQAEPLNGFGRGLLVSGAIAAAACLLTLTQPRPTDRRWPRWVLAVLTITAADLVIASWGLNPTIDAGFFAPRSLTATDRAYLAAETVEMLTYEQYFDFRDYTLAAEQRDDLRVSGLPNLNLLDRTPLLNNFDPLLIGGYAQFMNLLESTDDPTVRDRLLTAAGVGPAGRAWLVGTACTVPTDALAAALTAPDFDPLRRVYLTADTISGESACPEPAAGDGSVTVTADTGNRLDLRVTTATSAWLVLADTAYPGWMLTINGEPAAWQTANLAFRAVNLPAGMHDVSFRYAPGWLLPGAIVSGAALAIWLALWAWALTGRRSTK